MTMPVAKSMKSGKDHSLCSLMMKSRLAGYGRTATALSEGNPTDNLPGRNALI